MSLKIFKSAVLIKFTSNDTSRVRLDINLPVCIPFINFVSVAINDFIISFCTSALSSWDTLIIRTLARYNDIPLVKKAMTIATGIKKINV